MSAPLATQERRPPSDFAGAVACATSPAYFLARFAQIKEDQAWVPFTLWPAQRMLLRRMRASRRLAVLKARQLGISWLALGYALWVLLFRPGSLVLLISLRETEAAELLERLLGMYDRLPAFLRCKICERSANTATFSNGSRVRALPSNRGDSYNATLVVVDEADLIPHLDTLLGSVLPTVGDSGQIFLVSRSNKDEPDSTFKRLWKDGVRGGAWSAAFLAWDARPDRDAQWYEAQRAASLAVDGTLDTLHEQYPETPAEALAPSTGDRRLPPQWLLPCYDETLPITPAHDHPAAVLSGLGLAVFALPEPGRSYVVGCDPAGGLPTGDETAISVVDEETGQEVCSGGGQWEPAHATPHRLAVVSRIYNRAPLSVERNNHGHAAIAECDRLGLVVLSGLDDQPGFNKTEATRAQLWTDVAGELCRVALLRGQDPASHPPLLCSLQTYSQAALLEARTCKAPPGHHDDRADAWGVAQWGRLQRPAPPVRGLGAIFGRPR